jgi:hypothetical protein
LAFSRSAPRVVAALWVILFFMPCHCLAANHTYSYWLLDHPGGSSRYRLTASVTSSLYDYYLSKNHYLPLSEFAKFVTPNALNPVAEDLWSIYENEEDFANGVLMILHQIPYEESDIKYPVETIVENEGDCDTFSCVAASIMKAGGLEVVLLYYEAESHMNVGVHLQQAPQYARSDSYSYSYQGKKYYVAECTGGKWQEGWRVGECPEEFEGASATIITLENCEPQSPGEISSSYTSLVTSSISLTISSTYTMQSQSVIISGSISPLRSYKNVTVYFRLGSSWSAVGTLVTDANGSYSYVWRPGSGGIYYVTASWSGDSEYAGADSSTCRLIVIPIYWLILAIVAVVIISVALVRALLTRQTRLAAEVESSL